MPVIDRTAGDTPVGKAVFTLMRFALSGVVWWLIRGAVDTSLQSTLGWAPVKHDADYYTLANLFGALVFIAAVRQVYWTYAICTYKFPVRAAVSVAVFNFVMDALNGILLSRKHSGAMGLVQWLGLALFVMGSLLETGSEVLRTIWKQHPAHRGKPYTGGLFAYAVHINYFGYTLWRLGMTLVAGAYPMLLFVVFLVRVFIKESIPDLHSRNLQKYGAPYEEYARKTSKFVPFVY